MPSRKYYLVGDGTAINMRQKLAREKMIRRVSITSNGEHVGSIKSNYFCEVRKSPRAPEYVVHYVKTKANGIQLVKHKPRPVRRPPEKDAGSNLTQPSEYEDNLDTEVTDPEKDNMVGLRVIACNKQDGLYYPGHVSHTAESAFAIVNFNYHKRQKVRTQMIIPMSGAIPRPELAPGDFVLVRVFNQTKEVECYVPGIVDVTPEDSRHHAKFYSVLLYNGQRETTLRKFIVKIGKARFEMAIRYITHIQQQKILRQEKVLSDSSGLSSPQISKRSDDDVSSTRSFQSSQSGQGRRKKEKIMTKIGKRIEEKKYSKSRRKIRSRSKSSRSSSSESRSKSGSSASSRSRSSSRSSSSRSRSRSQGSKGSLTPRPQSPFDRPHRPTPNARPGSPTIRSESMLETPNATRKDVYTEQYCCSNLSKYVSVDEKDEIIQTLQYQIEKQKRKQFRQEQRLVRQARKINKIQRKLQDSDISHNESGQSDRSDRTRSRRSSTSENETSPRRRKGSPDGTSYGNSPDLQSLRRSLPGLQVDQEVLARWQDDGWYYQGCVVAEGKNHKYIIRDSTGYMETIARDDILTENEHRFDAIQPEDHVIGLHPKYVFSFAPAEVLSTYSNSSIKVEFFDGNIAELTEEDVYKISKDKFEEVVEYIKKCEKHLIGHSVVARDDTTGLYKLGIVDSRVGLGQQYYVKWLDGDMTKQNANHIFEVGRRQTHHEDWSHVLAPLGQQSMTFMPAEVIQSSPFMVQFCDGKRSTEATLDQCFWLSREYYSNARAYIMNMKYTRLTNTIHSERD